MASYESEPIGTMCSTTDVVINGGGPAGLSAAIALGKSGITCLVVDAEATRLVNR